MKWLLLLLPMSALAQTYDLNVQMGAQTYQGQFTWSGANGQDNFTNVAVSDSFAGMLTSAQDPTADIGANQGAAGLVYGIWFLNNSNLPLGIGITAAGGKLGGKFYTGTSATVDTPSGYVSCTYGPGCVIDITRISGPSLLTAPELSSGGLMGGVTLLGIMMLILGGRRATP